MKNKKALSSKIVVRFLVTICQYYTMPLLLKGLDANK